MNYLVLMRHGQSEWNKQNLFTGFKDVDLTEEGIAEAHKAGSALKESGIKFDQVFTSTLKRAIETTEIALKDADQADMIDTMIKHDDLRERNYGDLVGLNKADTAKKYGDEQVHIWRRSYDVPPPGGESLEMVVEDRVRPYYEAHIKPLLQEGKNVLLGAHGNTNRAMLIILGERTKENINEAEIPTGVPLVFEMDGDKILKSYYLK
ncbi:MAG: 2,3-bisphosphoglycerate-dependent phosphoglycerate mutase [Micavibrio sp.]|nr:2,3-bisphosphoglycerate-dependent phosphoglycerate mutase [Micavibrio sp.]HCK32712.1 2,3-bisphosphoglycerate-dependent phosphoglycerate mutase [Rhodospirillaceae bacterium]|tara:strand:+ start:357 stop:977 length:621 start_codon:yes stop_codon:yes gene_type:complete